MSKKQQAHLDLVSLLNTNDEEFVRGAYRLILGREADSVGLHSFLQQVRAGTDLRQLASELAHSEEGLLRPGPWQELLPIKAARKAGRLAWLRRRLFGSDTMEVLRGVGRVENRLYRLSQQLKAPPGPPIAAMAQSVSAPVAGSAAPASLLATFHQPPPATLPVSAALLGLGEIDVESGQWPVCLQRAVSLSAALTHPVPQALRPMRLLVEGHFSGTYSLAISNRKLVVQLLRHGHGLDLAIQPRQLEPTDEIKDLPGGIEEYQFFEGLLRRGKEADFANAAQVKLYYAWPPVRPTRTSGEKVIGVFFWEESAIPQEIIDNFNDRYDGLLVSTWFVKQTLLNNGCRIPVELLPFPIELIGRNSLQEPKRRRERQWIEFLHVSSCFARKGADALLKAFSEVALELPNIRLTIKTFENPHLEIRAQLERLVDPRVRERITLRIEDLDDEGMAALYRSSDAVVLPSRGEGLNMPAIEAAFYRIPVIATDYSGQADFATADNSWPVDFEFQTSKSHLESGDSSWCEPSHPSLCRQMRELALALMKQPQTVWDRADRLTHLVQETFLHPRAAIAFRSALQRLNDQPHPAHLRQPLRLTFVSSWMEVCGIAEYTRYLGLAMQANGTQVFVLAPEHKLSIAESPLPARKGRWLQTRYFRLDASDFDADAVWFQHHPAFFELGDELRHLVRQLSNLGKPSFITLHSTKELLLNSGRVTAVVACLMAFERVIVHSDLDRNLLLRIGLSQNVLVIPQGVPPRLPSSREALKTGASKVRIGSFGFLLAHKGIDKLIDMVAHSRKAASGPQLSLRLVNSVRGDAESTETYRQCVLMAHQLGASEVLEWHTDYLSAERIRELLSECDVLILPYQPTNESSSAAVRFAMATCAHVLVSAESIFDELRHCCFTVDASSGATLWRDLQAFLGQIGSAGQQERSAGRSQWLDSRDWRRVASRSQALVEACLADVRYSAANHR